MFLYNVTIGIDRDVEDEWLKWMKEEHIPNVLGTGMFASHKMYKVLQDEDEGTVSYSIQYFAETIEDVNSYLEHFAPPLIDAHRRRFANKHVAFRTLLEEV